VDLPFLYFYIAIATCTVGGPSLYRAILTRRFRAYEEAGRAALKAGELARAEELLTRSLRFADRNRCLQGARMACLHNLGLALFRQGKFEEAAARVEEVVRLCSSQQQQSKLLPKAVNLLAQIYWALGRCQDPITLYTWLLDLKTEYGSIDEPLTGAYNELGVAHMRAGDYARALTNLERAVELERQSDGDSGKASTFARNNRGALHQRSGELEQAERIWKEVLAIREKLAGEGGDRPARIRVNLAWLCCQQKRYQEAETLAREALTALESDRNRSYAFHTLAVLCSASGRLEEADDLFARVIEVRLGLMVRDHPDLLRMQADIAMLRMAHGRISQADELLTTARTLLEAKLGAEHPDVAAILYRLGVLRTRQARTSEAKDLFQAALAVKSRLAPAHPETEDCRKAFEELGL
jgi:tetratricopeptide (TPR) repeat protein